MSNGGNPAGVILLLIGIVILAICVLAGVEEIAKAIHRMIQ